MEMPVQATPAWNTVNGWNVDGSQCPLPTYNAYPCPVLCVQDINLCPESIRPSCPAGQTYCVDAICRESCPSNLESKCSCPGVPALKSGPIYQCLDSNRVNIENFDSNNKEAQVNEACANHIGLSNVSSWSSNTESIMWGTCPNADYGELTFAEPVFIALWVFYGSCVFFLVSWILYKRFREKIIKTRYHKVLEYKRDEYLDVNEKLGSEKKSLTTDTRSTESSSYNEQQDTIIKAYKRDFFGLFVLVAYMLQTIGMIAYMILITFDYYQDYYFFRGDALVQSSTFMGMWYVFFIWFACLTVFKSRLPNFFRIQCPYDEGQYVQVERKEASIIFLEDEDPVVRSVRYLERLSKEAFGLDVIVATAPLQTTANGTKYFIYQCTRYVYNPRSQLFKPHQYELGETNAELAKLDQGLSSRIASEREELVGPNFIEVYVPNMLMAILREFSSFFYIYQFTALWLFYYFAYWQVGIADTAVIIISALVKVFVRLKSELRIKKMAEFTDVIKILRDNQWVEASTSALVPGDVFEVAEGKTAPCDAVVLSGNIVADESSLTGEPLPIRKFPLRKDDPTRYDKIGAAKTSTIYAGTIISQAQRTESERPVTALVINTGTSTDKGELVKKILFPTRVSFIFDEQIKVVFLILLCCGLICLGLAIWLYTKGTSAWFYAMFAICQLVSPLLPAALVVGQSVAASRLRKKQIFCVDLPRILMAGKGNRKKKKKKKH
ncbi:hypothetical protein G6F25_009812 [Rhizopus arrhizus]|nr:hypothetical protein G6F25_009812 [Rhizopus arrhizus]